MHLIGTVLKSERIKGQNETRSWDFVQVTIWDGDEAQTCMIGREAESEVFGQGEDVVVEVRVQPRKNTRSGAYENSVTILRRVTPDELLDRLPAVASRAA